MRWQRIVLWVSSVLVVASVVAAWIAIGDLANSTDRALARTEQSLRLARQIAVDTAAGAEQFTLALGPVADGIGSTAEALVSTRDVSAGVRDALSGIRFIDDVQEVRARLEAAEAALAKVEIDLTAAQTTVEATQTALGTIVRSLRGIPAEMDATIDEVTANRQRIDRQILLWRLAAVGGGVALLGGLVIVGSLTATAKA